MEISGAAVQEGADEQGLPAANSVVADVSVICVVRERVDGLTLSDLDAKITELGKARAMIEGYLSEVLAERARLSSNRETASVLRERVLESAGRASSDVKIAVSLAENFPSTLNALVAGEINSGHARVINRVAGKPNYHDEDAILESARAVPSDLLSRHAMRRQPIDERDYTKYEQQHEDRRATITQEPDGSWKLFAHFDYLAGRQISMAWAQMAEALRRKETPDSEKTYLQRNADALYQLITRESVQHVPSAPVMIIADYDTATDTLGAPRLDDGHPIPPEKLEVMLENIDLYTAFVDAKGQPMWLGRSKRSASLAQRLMLAARDGGCVGCNTPSERCEAHHIQHWAANGETNIDNLTQLCPGCHHLVHDCNWGITQNQQGKYQIHAPPDPFPDWEISTNQPAQHNPILRN